jgi:predicted dehydrogenase
MEKIAIAVIGAGLIGRKHLAKIAAHPDYVLAGIADVNTDAVAQQYPEARVFADHRRLLDEAKPDVAIIASPNQVHAGIGIDCARRRNPASNLWSAIIAAITARCARCRHC